MIRDFLNAPLHAGRARPLAIINALAWTIALLVICVRVLIAPHSHNEYVIFAKAGQNWLAGQTLYTLEWDPFRYSPLVAALLAPISLLPLRIGSLLWRLMNVCGYLAGLSWFASTCLDTQPRTERRALLFLLVLPLSLSNLSNGQSNPLVLGLLLAALAAAASDRWNIAAACAAFATLFKLYPIATPLLLLLSYPRQFLRRFPAAILAGFGLPFLMQRPSYVFAQYSAWIAHLRADSHWNLPVRMGNRDLRMLMSIAHVPVGIEVYESVALMVALGLSVLCFVAHRAGRPRPRLMVTILGLSTCWMVLLGPASDGSTFVLAVPALVVALVLAWQEEWSFWLRGLPCASYLLILAAFLPRMVTRAPPPLAMLGFQPFAILLLMVCFVTVELRWLTSREQVPAAAPLAAS